MSNLYLLCERVTKKIHSELVYFRLLTSYKRLLTSLGFLTWSNPGTDVHAKLYPHRGTREGGGGGRWLMEPHRVFDMLQYSQTFPPLMTFSTRWGIFYGWWYCWRPVISPNVAILAGIFLPRIRNQVKTAWIRIKKWSIVPGPIQPRPQGAF